MDENIIVITDDNGQETEYEILFTFDNEENGNSYVVYFDPREDEPQAQASIYTDDGQLLAIEDPEEWEMIEEVFQSFVAQDEDDDETEYCEEDCH